MLKGILKTVSNEYNLPNKNCNNFTVGEIKSISVHSASTFKLTISDM